MHRSVRALAPTELLCGRFHRTMVGTLESGGGIGACTKLLASRTRRFSTTGGGLQARAYETLGTNRHSGMRPGELGTLDSTSQGATAPLSYPFCACRSVHPPLVRPLSFWCFYTCLFSHPSRACLPACPSHLSPPRCKRSVCRHGEDWCVRCACRNKENWCVLFRCERC